MNRLRMLHLGLMLPLLSIADVTRTSGQRSIQHAEVPVSALRALLVDRSELLGSDVRLLLCPGLVTPTVDTVQLRMDLGVSVVFAAECSPTPGGIVGDEPGETLVLERAFEAGDSLIVIGHAFRVPVARSGPIEVVSWGERVALLRVRPQDSWYVASFTLTGVARAINRRPRAGQPPAA